MGKDDCNCEEPEAGAPLWMATFSDMVTLLLTFFVLLLSMASFEEPTKVSAVIQSIRTAFGSTGLSHSSLGVSEQVEQTPTEMKLMQETISPQEARLREAMAKHISDELVRMVSSERELRIRMDERVLFKPGSTELHPAAYALVSDVAAVLKDQDVHIRVEGHTDATGDEWKNWELASKRSMSVVRALRERGPIPGERLEADSFGEFQPASTIGEAPQWNRRVELVLKSDQSAAVGAIEALKGR